MNDSYFITNQSFSLALLFSSSKPNLLRYQIRELILLSDSTQSGEILYYFELTPKSSDKKSYKSSLLPVYWDILSLSMVSILPLMVCKISTLQSTGIFSVVFWPEKLTAGCPELIGHPDMVMQSFLSPATPYFYKSCTTWWSKICEEQNLLYLPVLKHR
jgi:hypothetical protein